MATLRDSELMRRSGDLVLSKGEVLGAAEIGILATVGATAVSVYRCVNSPETYTP